MTIIDDETLQEYLGYIESDGHRHFTRGLQENGLSDSEIDVVYLQIEAYEKLINEAY